MNRKKSSELSEEIQNKIISAAYGDAALWDKIRVLRIISKNPEAKKLYASFMLTAAEVKQIKEDEYKNDFVSRLTRENVPATKDVNSITFDFLSIVFTRPIISFAVGMFLLTFIALSVFLNKPVQRNSNEINEAEIQKAGEQAKYAFEIVDNIFKQTNSTLQKEILEEKVAKPIKESVGLVNNILKGEKNETN